ncbi:MAG: site-specific integrase [Fusobacterium sp.]|nr:site-specific integrase [Fusobacterium sp.]
MGSVRKKGTNWYYYFEVGTVNGKRKRIERAGGKTKKEALKALALAEAEYFESGNIKVDSSESLADYLNYWIEEIVKPQLSYNTYITYSYVLDNHLIPELGSYKLKELNPMLLQKFINKKYNSGYSYNTLKGIKRVLGSALKYAVYPAQKLRENPAAYIQMPKEKICEKRSKIISEENYKRILAYIEKEPSLANMIQIGWHTGMRCSEICGLSWDNVDFDNQVIHVKNNLIKKGENIELCSLKTTSSYRDIYFGKELESLLRKQRKLENIKRLEYGEHWKNDFNLVCTRENGKAYYANLVTKRCSNISKALGIDFTFHMLRHTNGTRMLEAGVQEKVIQERLGHASINTTMNVYVKSTEELNRDAAEKLEALSSAI